MAKTSKRLQLNQKQRYYDFTVELGYLLTQLSFGILSET